MADVILAGLPQEPRLFRVKLESIHEQILDRELRLPDAGILVRSTSGEHVIQLVRQHARHRPGEEALRIPGQCRSHLSLQQRADAPAIDADEGLNVGADRASPTQRSGDKFLARVGCEATVSFESDNRQIAPDFLAGRLRRAPLDVEAERRKNRLHIILDQL